MVLSQKKVPVCSKSFARCGLVAEIRITAVGQADRPIFGIIRLQALTICRLRHDWVDSRCAGVSEQGERRGCGIQVQVWV